MEPIGFVESCYKDKFGVPRQPGLVKSATLKLKIRSDLQPVQALQGIEGFSHLWLIWIFHQNRTSRYHGKVHPPRLNGQTMGVFATRTPHRPNPIGLSLVRLEKVDGDTLWLSGGDLMDGTPILDIKPYLPEIESVPLAQSGWTAEAERPRLNVVFSEEAVRQLQEKERTRPKIQWREIMTETISLDPRPEIYREGEDGEGWLRRPNHAFRLHDVDVHFRMITAVEAEIFNILPLIDEIPPSNLRKFEASIKSQRVTENSPGEGFDDGNDDVSS